MLHLIKIPSSVNILESTRFMNGFLSSLRNFIVDNNRALDNAVLAQPVEMELDPSLQHWKPEEANIILQCEKEKSPCYTTSLDRRLKSQTVILGVDLDQNHILIDEPFPRMMDLHTGSSLEMVAHSTKGSLAFTVRLTEFIHLAGSPAVMGKIIAKQPHEDRRIQSRTSFSGTQRPVVNLLMPLSGRLLCSLSDLSAGGLSMTCLNSSKPDIIGGIGECVITLGDFLRINAMVDIRSLSFCRKPYKHYIIRATFTKLAVEQKEQINLFVEQHRQAQIASTPGLGFALGA